MARKGEEGGEGAYLMGLKNAVAGWLPAGYEPGFFDVVAFVGGGVEVGCVCCCCCGEGFGGLAI